MTTFLRSNALSLTLLATFVACLVAQIAFGHRAYDDELVRQGMPPIDLWSYLHSGHFVSALMENWESEFLQMGMYVLLTVHLRQRGSAESRPFERSAETIEAGPAPWPVRAGGLWRALYERSLSIAMFLLFAIAFAGHAVGSWMLESEQRTASGLAPERFIEHVAGAQFWFESMQNWQSEFLAVLSLVVFSIFLRQKDSPQSKPVEAPHRQTGS
ncbi:DUF6766 family protein [Dokdonella sp.]|uniref:DUF6766 family protein n=1 Tax=Dokdonella sp. TaxID=2291710 RepID=UPI002F4235B2